MTGYVAEVVAIYRYCHVRTKACRPSIPNYIRNTALQITKYAAVPTPAVTRERRVSLDTSREFHQWVGTTSRGPTGVRVPSWGNLITN